MPRAIHTIVAEAEQRLGPEGTAELARRIKAQATRFRLLRECPTALDLAARFDPTIVRVPALELLDQRLHNAMNTRDGRLVVSIGPQFGKSSLARWAILRALVENPNRRIVLASYAASLARTGGRIIRGLVEANNDALGVNVAWEHRDASDWQLENHAGGLYCVGVNGGLTGRPADCVSGDTVLCTPNGLVSARDLYQATGQGTQYVLSYNHDTERNEYRRVIAARRIDDRACVDVVTESGRFVRCTDDHQFHTPDGYRSAAILRPGDQLTITDLFRVRETNRSARKIPDVLGLLHDRQSVDLLGYDVQPVREQIPAHESRAREEAAARSGESVLLGDVCRGVTVSQSGRSPLPAVSQADRERQRPQVLRSDLPGRSSGTNESSDRGSATETSEVVSALRGNICAQNQPDRLLLASMRQLGALAADDRRREFSLPERNQLRGLVPQDAPADYGTGRGQVRGLRTGTGPDQVPVARETAGAQCSGGSSHRREPVGQSAGELDPFVSDLSREASQIGHDTVFVVRRVCGDGESVYDFQVEGNRNFFANEVLAHNCMIIDDPLRGYQDADSDTIRSNLHEWWGSVARTRLAPGAPVVIIATRWHEDDLSGRLVAEGWPVVNIPALADGKVPDALDRPVGEWLVSTRGTTVTEWEATRRDVGERVFAALYQGVPSPPGGDIFREEWFIRDRVAARPAGGQPPLVFIDPADNPGTGDEAGILVGSLGSDQRIYLGPDYSGHYTVGRWVRVALLACARHRCAGLVFEQSLSGLSRSIQKGWEDLRKQALILRDLGVTADTPLDARVVERAVNQLAHAHDPAETREQYQAELIELWPLAGAVLSYTQSGPQIRRIKPQGTKEWRAKAASPAYERRQVSHVGQLPELEYQMITWQSGMASPDRLDCAVHLVLHLSGSSPAELVAPAGQQLPTRSTRAPDRRSMMLPRSTMTRR